MFNPLRISALFSAAAVLSLSGVAAAKPATPAPAPAAPTKPKPADPKPTEPKPTDSRELKAAKDSKDAKAKTNALAYTVKDIDGNDVNLAEAYKGKVVLIVNVASKCGYTAQYEGLQKLYTEKKDKGLVILGFPANNFGDQEPGTEKEIKEFCSSKFAVTFPMFSKLSVKGESIAPLFKALTDSPNGGAPKWNFIKYLIDSEGKLITKYDSAITPDDKAMNAKIDELLAAKPAEAKKAEPVKAGS